MGFKIFGFEIKKTAKQSREEEVLSSIAPESREVETSDAVVAGGIHGVPYEIDAARDNEGQLVNRYRSMMIHPEVDEAVTAICNEAIVYNEDRKPVTIDLTNAKIADSVKEKIVGEFENILSLLNFSSEGHDLFKRWYVDGKLAYHIVIDKDKPEKGIVDLRRLDPRRIRKITKIIQEEDPETKTKIVKGTKTNFIYNQALNINQGGSTVNTQIPAAAGGAISGGYQDVVISKDSIIYCTSGLVDTRKNCVVGHLHKAIRPLNQLKMMEDALVIYRFSRAPERRVFYIDVGSLPKAKAEQYVKNLMQQYKQKLIYDPDTGTIRSENKHTTMLEDFWLPRREGGRGTEISTLAGGQNLSQIEDIQFFEEKLYKSLNVPISRLNPDTGFSLGRASEITRDEVKFSRFVDILRNQFSELFLQALRVQLILKKVITESDWKKVIRNNINFKYANDSFFSQLKELEITQERIRALQEMKEYVGIYYSHDYIQKNVLGLSDEDIMNTRKQLEAEKKDGFYNTQDDENNAATSFGGGGGGSRY